MKKAWASGNSHKLGLSGVELYAFCKKQTAGNVVTENAWVVFEVFAFQTT